MKKFLFINAKIKYTNLTNYFYNQAMDYFILGYSEAKVFLFLYALFNLNLKLYREEKENFYLIILDKINKIYEEKPVAIYIYRSKCIENIKIFFKFIKYSFIFSKSSILQFLITPYFSLKRYNEIKKVKKIVSILKEI